MKKYVVSWAAVLICLGLFAGCAQETGQPVSSEPVVVDEPAPQEPIVQEPETVASPLTGLPTDPEVAVKRPIAFMINNLKLSLPQYGVAQADIVYEALAEGGITRLLAVYQDYTTVEKIAWIRSARDYYIDFAQNHDAVFAHFGGSPKAFEEVKARKIDTLEGIFGGLEGITFLRDPQRRKAVGAEHSVYATADSVTAGLQKKGLDLTANPDLEKMLYFNEAEVSPNGTDVVKLSLNYPWSQNKVEFKYDAQSKTYLRFQFGQPHVDALDGKQLAFTNLLVLFTQVNVIKGDAEGRLSVGTVGQGSGWYLSAGKKIEIKWSKKSHADPLSLKSATGEQLFINQGKTFISIYPDGYQDRIKTEA